jgi:hypothetical protein
VSYPPQQTTSDIATWSVAGMGGTSIVWGPLLTNISLGLTIVLTVLGIAIAAVKLRNEYRKR